MVTVLLHSGATDMGYYQSAGTNIILKGDSVGRSGIFFESEKDGTNINDPSDYGFIQFHSYGYGNTSGEAAAMVIGVSNDSTDKLILQAPYNGGVMIGYKDATSGVDLTLSEVIHSNSSSYNAGNWDTAYGWGNHSGLYLPINNPTLTGVLTLPQHLKATGSNLSFSAGGNQILNIDLNGKIYPSTDNSTDLGFSTSSNRFRNGNFSGTVTASGGNSGNWNTAYGWGNHASGGYASSGHVHTFASLTSKPTTLSGYGITDGINSTEPNQSFNPFGGQKYQDGVLTNRIAGKWDRFVVTIDGTVETNASKKLSNQNFEEYNQNRLFGTSAGETKVFNINLQYLQSGNLNNNGITYCSGFFDICFYSSPFPASYSARVKNKDGNWYNVTNLTKIGSSKLRGVMPIGNYATDIEFTLTARTSAPFVTGNVSLLDVLAT